MSRVQTQLIKARMPRRQRGTGRAVSEPARGAGEASETGREQRLAQPRATDHFDRHGVIRGIQRGTAARNASYSLPNVRSSVGSSYATTKTWKASQSSAP